MSIHSLSISRLFSLLLIVVAILLSLPNALALESTGPQRGTTTSIVPRGWGLTWANPNSAIGSNDSYASVTVGSSSGSDELHTAGFGFDIPFGATITGMLVTIERRSDPAQLSSTALVGASLDGVDLGGSTPGGGFAFDSEPFLVTDSILVVGGDSGPSLGRPPELTPEIVNDPGFGVFYLVGFDPATFFVDDITVEIFFELFVEEDPCDAFPGANADFVSFQNTFDTMTNDLDGDGMQDGASLALMQAAACDPNAPESLTAAFFNAYNINLVIFDGEADAASLAEFRSLIALLMAISDAHEAAIKAVLAAAMTPITLTGDYVAVTCMDAVCMPAAIPEVPITEEFEVFADFVRAANEPFSATGDLDGDGTDNITELNNVLAQGGTLADFVIAATTATLDGTEDIRTLSGSSGCFIATAAYGTPLHTKIDTLRTFRDQSMLTNPLGVALANAYYRLSPSVADRVAQHPNAATAVRLVLRPVLLVTGLTLGLQVALAALAFLFPVVLLRARNKRRAG